MNERKIFKAYKLYIALKLHFNSDYDAIKFRGSVSAKPDSLELRNDLQYFIELSNHDDIPNLLVSNFIVGDRWIGDIVSQEGLDLYKDFYHRNSDLEHTFREDLKCIDPCFKNNIIVSKGQIPILLKEYRKKNICLETLVILDKCFKLTEKWDKKISDYIIWPRNRHLIRKYHPFVNLEKELVKDVLSSTFM